MEYDQETQVFNFVSGLFLGAVIGAGIALLAAPHSGRRTRKRIRKVAGDLKHTASDRWDELADDVKEKVDEAIQVAKKRLPA